MNIPGFQWDPEKKRYFKILKSGELPNSRYTVSAIAERERSTQREAIRAESIGSNQRDSEFIHPDSRAAMQRLGKKAKIFYSGRPDELLSCGSVSGNSLITGSKTGVIACGNKRTSGGRTVISLDRYQEHGLAAVAVDHEYGSFVTTGSAVLSMPREFATDLKKLPYPEIGVSSQRGLTLWHPETNAVEVFSTGSSTALSVFGSHGMMVGTKDGSMKVVDTRAGTVEHTSSMANMRAVTHVAPLSDYAIIATGLEDEMSLFDLRSGSEPVFQFAEYHNWSTVMHGFALNPQRNTVAVAMDTGAVEAYDATSGTKIGTVIPANNRCSIPTWMQWTGDALYIAVDNKVVTMPRRPAGLAHGHPAGESRDLEDYYLDLIHVNLNTGL